MLIKKKIEKLKKPDNKLLRKLQFIKKKKNQNFNNQSNRFIFIMLRNSVIKMKKVKNKPNFKVNLNQLIKNIHKINKKLQTCWFKESWTLKLKCHKS